MNTHYFLLGENNIILDAIQYPAEGYVEVSIPQYFLPAGINGGWYHWNGTEYVFDQDLYDAAHVGE